MKATRTCSVDDCKGVAEARGWCTKHYARWRRHGDVNAGPGRRWIASNGYEKSYLPDHPTASPTGQVYTHRQTMFDLVGDGTHSCHWCDGLVTWFTREWHSELVVDHVNGDRLDNRVENLVVSCNRCNIQRDRRSIATCRNGHPFGDEPPNRGGHRVCAVCLASRREREMAKRTRNPRPELTHCLRGHEYTPENTYVTPRGKKKCRACRRERDLMAREEFDHDPRNLLHRELGRG